MVLFLKTWPLMAATLLYVWQMIILLWTKEWGAAITFAGYATANLGLIWSLAP